MVETLTIVEHETFWVARERNISKKTISIEDREEILTITHKNRFNKPKQVFSYKGNKEIKAKSIVGSISLKSGLIIEILPKFAKGNLTAEAIIKYRENLLHMIQVSNEKNFISSTLQSSKVSVGEMPLIRYMIELFSESLLYSLRNGMVTTYNKTVENSSYIRGNILVTKTIQNNFIDKSKVYISYNKHSSNNLLMQIFKTLSKLLLNDTNLSYRAKQYLYEVYVLLDSVEIIPLKEHHFDKVIFNRLNDKYETLFRQAEFIFNQYMPFTSNINSTPFWAILFNMDYLFEKFCAYLLRRSNIEIEEQSKIDCFNDGIETVRMKPDFLLFNQDKISCVVDAKWKLLDKKETLYGLTHPDFWQLFTYMNLTDAKEELNGYFIVPKNGNDFDDEIIFDPIKKGSKPISIFSIDFSLDFEEILERYQFKLENGCLKIDLKEKKEQEVIEVIKEK
jgi:5-methylcytosine-specific restriction endonuclease McrBC regulatory subunit McrC